MAGVGYTNIQQENSEREGRVLEKGIAAHALPQFSWRRAAAGFLLVVGIGSAVVLVALGVAPCSVKAAFGQVPGQLGKSQDSVTLLEDQVPKTPAEKISEARSLLGSVKSKADAERITKRLMSEAGQRGVEAWRQRMAADGADFPKRSDGRNTLPGDPLVKRYAMNPNRDLHEDYDHHKFEQWLKYHQEKKANITAAIQEFKAQENLPSKNRQNVLVRCLIDVMASTQSVAALGTTIKGEIDTCKNTGKSSMMDRQDTLDPATASRIEFWTPEKKAELACFLNSNGIVQVLSNLASALAFAAGDCAWTINVPDNTQGQLDDYYAALCAANIASTVNVVSQFATAGAMAGTSCPNVGSKVSAPVDAFGTEADDTVGRRLIAGSAGAPQLGAGKDGNSMGCLVDAEGVLFSIMQIGVEMDYAYRNNCATGEYTNAPQNGLEELAEKVTHVSSALCSANVGGVIQGFVNIVTVGQLMVMHCDNIMTASRMCGQGISMFFSAAANLVRGTGQLYDFCELKAFTSADVVSNVNRSIQRKKAGERYVAHQEHKAWLNDKYKKLQTAVQNGRRLMAEGQAMNAVPRDPASFFQSLGYNISNPSAAHMKNALKRQDDLVRLVDMLDPALREAKDIQQEKQERATWWSPFHPTDKCV